MSPRRRQEDEGEELEQEEELTTRGRHPSKRTKLFSDSGLSDLERREIRQNQRALQQTLRDGEHSTIDELSEARKTNNAIFNDKVRYTREAVLDADNVDLIAAQFAQQVEKLVQAPRYDHLRFAQKLVQKCSNRSSSSQYFDWKLLGCESGICFNALPERVAFLAGALDHDVTLKKKAARKPREKAVVDDSEEVKPETVKNDKSDVDKLSAMEKTMRVIRRKLVSRTLEEKEKNPSVGEHPDIDGVQFLVNPKSFTQTVENIFNFSFLIKKGEAEIGVRPRAAALDHSLGGEKKPGLFAAHRTLSDPDVAAECTQAVCSFTMADWRRLCASQNLQEGDLPHRTGTKHGRAHASSSQQPVVS